MQTRTPAVFTKPKVLPLPSTPLEWLTVFGPGAVVASLTIGTGELIFSTRGGALFGYHILFVFAVISVLKWGMVLASARHMVLTGVHPFKRMLDLPGPHGWLPLMLLIMAAVCMPIWISFHSGVLGNLTSWITNTKHIYDGGLDYLWGMVLLISVLVLAASSGYSILERLQMFIVLSLVFCATASLIVQNPKWVELLLGLAPRPLSYPPWLEEKYPQIAANSVWVETTRYAGVIGGAGFDYMAYTSWLREKKWGVLPNQSSNKQLAEIAREPQHPVRQWVRAPMIDSTISFALIVAFSAVFVASGAQVLRPNEVVPDEENLLNLQARFVTAIHGWLLPLYIVGAFLTMIGTLYGTIEMSATIADEIVRSFASHWDCERARRLKLATIGWCASIALMILAWLFVRESGLSVPGNARVNGQVSDQDPSDTNSSAVPSRRPGKPRLLLALLTPVNLFTGVLACGLICWLNLWMDWKFMPRGLRMPLWLLLLNVLSGSVFLLLGLKGYWDNHNPAGPFVSRRWFAMTGLAGTALLAMVLAGWLGKRRSISLTP